MAKYYTGRVADPSLDKGYSKQVGELLRRRNIQGLLFEITGDSLRQVSFGATIGMKDIFGFAAQNMTGEIGEMMTAFADAVKYRATRNIGMQKMHHAIGKQAQAAIVSSYKSIERPRISYRLNERYAGKKLDGALESSSFFDAQPDGLLFINKSMLDRQAAQWYRLNFGAGSVGHFGGKQPGLHPLNWPGASGQSGGSLHLRNFGVSASFNMPVGLFTRGLDDSAAVVAAIKEVGKARQAARRFKNTPEAFGAHHGSLAQKSFDTFFVKRQMQTGFTELIRRSQVRDPNATFFPYTPKSIGLSKASLAQLRPEVRPFLMSAIPTLGIRAEGFFEAGMQSLAQQIPLNYAALMRQWLDDSLRESRGPAYKAGITGARAANYQAAFGTKVPAAYREAYKWRLKRGLI